MLIDTHCHIHDADYPLDAELAISHARQVGVLQMICVGTDIDSSKLAINFADNHDDVFATIGVHPHELKKGFTELENLIIANKDNKKLVAIGEIGLDYHYDFNPRDAQIEALRTQIKLAQKYNLPIIFHVREAFADFWKVFDEFDEICGVLHSFTDNQFNADEALKRGLYIGVNGYCTFVKDEASKKTFTTLPLDKIILETDAPYLTPAPFRGKVNEPAFVRDIAEFFSVIRDISVDKVAEITTTNAKNLFKI